MNYVVSVPIAGFVTVEFEYAGEPEKSSGLDDPTEFEKACLKAGTEEFTKCLKGEGGDYDWQTVVTYSRGNVSMVDNSELEVIDFYD